MTHRGSAAERAADIAAAIGRFEGGTTEGAHDGRLIAENLGAEVGFGGSTASRRQQVQQYFGRFPELKERWRNAVQVANTRAGHPVRDMRADLNRARKEIAELRAQVDSLGRVADLWRRKAQQLERRLDRRSEVVSESPPALDNVVVIPTWVEREQ